MIGLSVLFSKQTRSAAESHQLRSTEPGSSRFGNSRKRGTLHSHPLSVPQATAWGSDEHILPEDSDGKSSNKDGNAGIVIAQEISVQSDPLTESDLQASRKDPAANDWGYKASGSRRPQQYRA